MATILLTGATGAVGSSLVPLLKERGHKLICLVRGSDPISRLQKAVGCADGIAIFNGDVTLPNLGVCDCQMQKWHGRIDKVLHCASSIKFDEALAKEITCINVCGTQNVLDFARNMDIPEIHYVSTAYVAGDAETFSESNVDIGQKCRNVYERTKLQAEKLVKAWNYGKYSIYRLSIVVGDTITGWTPSFSGYYGFLGSVWHLRQTFVSMSKQRLEKYEGNGIAFNGGGMLKLPIYGQFSPISTLNIVPIDWVVSIMANLVEFSTDGRVFHIVHPNPPKVQWLNDVSLKHLGVTDFHYGEPPKHDAKSLLGRFQRVFDRSTAQYLPYIMRETRFDVSNLPRVLGRNFVSPVAIDESFVAKLMDYAKSVNFGKD